MVMGANIGTSLTSTLVSLTQMTDRTQFELAFAGATVHDCFNWLTVVVLLTLETSTGYLYHLTFWLTQDGDEWMVDDGQGEEGGQKKGVSLLKALTKPVTKRVVQVSKGRYRKKKQTTAGKLYFLVDCDSFLRSVVRKKKTVMRGDVAVNNYSMSI